MEQEVGLHWIFLSQHVLSIAGCPLPGQGFEGEEGMIPEKSQPDMQTVLGKRLGGRHRWEGGEEQGSHC